MEYVIVAVIVIGLIIMFGKSKNKDKAVVQPQPVTPPANQPPTVVLNTKRLIIMNDFQRNLLTPGPGDPDSAQDFGMMIAAMHHFEAKPLAVGCTWMDGQPTDQIPRELLDVSGMSDVPTVLGAATPKWKSRIMSPLSRVIIDESMKGQVMVTCGGTTGDLANAIYNGANNDNIIPILTPDTWNQNNNPDSVESTNYVLMRCPHAIITPKADRWHMIAKPRESFRIQDKTDIQWLEDKRDVKMWDLANNANIINQIRSLNTQMSQFENDWAIRAADCVDLFQAFGVASGAHEHQYNIIDNGIAKMRAKGL